MIRGVNPSMQNSTSPRAIRTICNSFVHVSGARFPWPLLLVNDQEVTKSAARPWAFSASTFASTEVYIPNYAGSTNKSYAVDQVQETNGTTAYMNLLAGLWSNTAAITSIKIEGRDTTITMVQHSTATLYGISRT